MEFELQTLDQRLGKFEGVQQQHDQRLADIERRLGTIEVLIRDVRAEGHREREALRTELTSQIHETRTELIGHIESVRTELTRGIACKYCVGVTHFNCENQFLFPIVVTGCLTCDPLAD